MGAKEGIKLAYDSDFASIFSSDGYPMLLDRCLVKKISRP